MNLPNRYVLLTVAALAPFASAQVVGNATAAAGGATRVVTPPPTPAQPASTLQQQTQVTTGGTANAGVNATAPQNTATLPGPTVTTGASASATVPPAPTPSAAVGVSATPSGVQSATTASGSFAAGANPADVARDIRSATDANRETMLAQIETRRETTAQEIATLRDSTRRLDEAGRARFDAAYGQVRSREAALRRSVREARNASGSAAVDAQSKLAADYQAYNEAVAAAEAAARVSADGSARRD